MKSRSARVYLILGLIVVSSLVVRAQDPRDEDVKISSLEVSLDVVARDKRGHIITDLKPSDVEVLEDGVPQELTSFRLVGSTRKSASESAARSGQTPTVAVMPQDRRAEIPTVAVTALVFDAIPLENRARTVKAARTYVEKEMRPGDVLGVFGVEQGLRTYQEFTTHSEDLTRALERFSTTAETSYRGEEAPYGNTLRGSMDASTKGGAGPDSSRPSLDGGTGDTSGSQIAQMQLRMRLSIERMARDIQSLGMTDGLQALVEGLSTVPGRKAVVLFSQGLVISDVALPRFRSIISAANRANVSFYTVDAAGLRVDSTSLDTAHQINAAAQDRLNSADLSKADRPLTRDLERNEDFVRSQPESGLTTLAAETGGFLISDTNDLGGALRRIDEDLHAYYLMTYAPKAPADGRYHTIAVRSKRSNITLQSRAGYYAIPNLGSVGVAPYEATALALLGSERQVHAFDFRADGFVSRKADGSGSVSVVAEMPAGAFTYTVDEAKGTYSADFVVVGLLREESGLVAAKVSNHYQRHGSKAELEEAKRGDVLFFRDMEVAPGHYVLDTAAVDTATSRASTARIKVDVPEPAKLSLGSPILIKRTEHLAPGDRSAPDAFRAGEVLVYPNLGEPVSKARSQAVGFLVPIYIASGTDAPTLMIDVLQNGRVLASVPAQLPAPDANGTIKFAGALPTTAFQSGRYELRFVASAGELRVSQTLRLSVIP